MWSETFVERKISYFLELDGKLVMIENVPARVCLETGEQLFAPEIVELLQKIVWGQRKPQRIVQTPVYEFA